MSFLSPRQYRPSAQTIKNQTAYIPPQAQQAIQQQLERLPANLKQYAGGDRYVPQHAQAALEKHLNKTAPGHLKEYTGAFVQQNIVTPGQMPGARAPQPAGMGTNMQRPDQLRLGHSNVSAPQYTAQFQTYFTPDGNPGNVQPQQAPAQPGQPMQPGQAPAPSTPYDFIMTAPTKPTPKFSLPGSHSRLGRIGLVVGGLLVLIILLNVVKGIVSPPPNLDGVVSVVQDQQVLITLTGGDTTPDQATVSTNTQNFTATTNVTVTSSQSQLLTYLANLNKKLKPDQLSLKVSDDLTQQLSSAATAGTYEQTYREIMDTQLKTYLVDLKQAYGPAGKNGKALLTKDYDQVALLQNQLGTSSTTGN